MGEVYRARDTRLDRTVAIKVLPDSFVADPQLRERFAREARVISSLDHPHICMLYDVGEVEHTSFLVMQYLEGETLEQRLAKGALPLDQALRHAIDIADALHRAHRQGIVHRDLKPGNIMITKSGAKVLDFGLAKTHAPGGAGPGSSGVPTTPPTLTARGVILGTFQYMAPEQLEGNEADARSDIFALGAVVYEMVTGKRAFEGRSQASLISAIMSGTPAPISSLQPVAPASLDRIVTKCLEKDPEDRWQTARDLEDELKWVTSSAIITSTVAPQAPAARSARRNAAIPWAIAGTLALVLAAVGLFWGFTRWGSTPEVPSSITFAAALPDGWGLAPVQSSGYASAPLAVSPDGRRVAFAAMGPDKRTQIWVRALDALAPLPLPGTAGASSPFWSPDGRFIAFFADGSLKKIDVTGGPAITLCAAADNMGGTWSTTGVIVFSAGRGGLLKVAASGGVPTPATQLKSDETLHWRPSFLPDGRRFIHRANTKGHSGPFYIASIDSPDRTLILEADASNAVYSAGYLLFMLGSTLMAQPFDAARGVISGEPTPVAERVDVQATNTPNGLFSASPNGVLAYRSGESAVTGTDLIWYDRSGKEIGKLGPPARYGDIELSPDGTRLAVSVTDIAAKNVDLWIFDIDRNVRTRFTSDPATDNGARWTADGKLISYAVSGKGLFVKPSGSSADERKILDAAHNEYPDSWTPDQRSLLYEMDDPRTSWDLWVLPLAPGSKPYPFIQAPLRQEYGRVSPDGRWVAYRSTESGRDEIYLVPFPGPGDKVQVSVNGGIYPRWRRDGRELFYLSLANKIVAVPVDGTGGVVKVGAEMPLFDVAPSRGDWPYDVTADGKRFIVNSRIEQSSSTPFTVVVNWTAALKN
jgi:Tol biopolymer transport system component